MANTETIKKYKIKFPPNTIESPDSEVDSLKNFFRSVLMGREGFVLEEDYDNLWTLSIDESIDDESTDRKTVYRKPFFRLNGLLRGKYVLPMVGSGNLERSVNKEKDDNWFDPVPLAIISYVSEADGNEQKEDDDSTDIFGHNW